MIQHTLYEWSREIGKSRETIARALEQNGVKITPKSKIRGRDVFRAETGDKEAAMTRKLIAEAEEKERENRKAEGEILTVEEADAALGQIVTALTQGLDSLPALIPGLTGEQRQKLVAEIEKIKETARNK